MRYYSLYRGNYGLFMTRIIILWVLACLAACQTPIKKVPETEVAASVKKPLAVCPFTSDYAAYFIDDVLQAGELCLPLVKNTVDSQLVFTCENTLDCQTIHYSPALALMTGQAKLASKDITNVQQQAQLFTRSHNLIMLDTINALDTVLRSGLHMWDKLGVNPYQKGLLASLEESRQNLYTGVAAVPDILAFNKALKEGNTFLSANKMLSLDLSAGFSKRCDLPTRQGAVLPVAPYKYEHLWFALKAPIQTQENAYLVKHWLDLKGNLHKKNMPINYDETCSLIKDNAFDPAYSSVYYLKIGDTAVSSPIWYLPIQG